MLFRDLYEYWLPDGLPAYRDEWDNRCPGSVFDIATPLSSSNSIDECGQACDDLPDCMQFSYSQDGCRLYKCFTLGKTAPLTEDAQWQSVWRTGENSSMDQYTFAMYDKVDTA